MVQPPRTVLIVDDSPEDRALYQRYLLQDEEYTYTVLEVSLGQQGLDLCQQKSLDMVLLDYRLPDLDGLEFLAQLQALNQLPALPVIVVTGQGNETIAVQAMKAGAQDYLVKHQLTPQKLQLAVKGAIETVQLQAQLQQQIGQERLEADLLKKVLQQAELYQQAQTELAERKRVEAELRASKEHLQLALQASRTGTWAWNIQTGLIQWSDNLEPLFGLGPGEFDGSFDMFIDRVHPDDREYVITSINQAIATGKNYEIEFRIVYPNGRIRWALSQGRVFYDKNGQPLRMVGNDIDISELKRTAEALQDSEKRFRQLTENIDAVFWIREVVGDRVSYVSPAYERLWGLNRQELYEDIQTWANYIHPEDRESSSRAFQEKAAAGQFDEEYRIVLPDGTIRWLRDRCFPLYDETGNLYRFTGIAEDITDRKRAEKNLHNNEQLLRLALTSAQAGSWDWEITTGKINWSPENFLLYGLEPKADFPQYEDWYNALHPEDREWVNAEVLSVVERRSLDFKTEFRIIHREKGVRWLLALGQLTLDQQGNPMRLSGINIDITDRKQAETTLQQSEERYRTLFESMEDGFCVIQVLFDENDTAIDYRFLETNPAFEQQTGLRQAEGKTARQLLPNLEEFWFETYGRVALTGESIRFENGAEVMNRWFDVYAFRISQPRDRKVALLFKEISDRKQADKMLQERNQHIQLLYETTSSLLSTDQPLKLVKAVFEELKPLIGLDVCFNYMLDEKQQKLRLTFYEGISSDIAQEREWLDLEHTICGTAALLRGQTIIADLQHSRDPKTQHIRSLGVTAYAAQPLIAQNRLFGTLSFGSRSRLEFTSSEKDLFQAICDQIAIAIERSELLSSLQKQTDELIQANRMKDEFLAVLSHELRSPLNPILGWTKLLQSRKFDPAKTAEALATIERNVNLQTQLIDDLLDVAKILRGKLNMNVIPVNLTFVIESAIDTVKAAAIAKDILLHPVLPAVGRVSGDPARLQQIVWNLLSNAIKFTPANGRVDIRLERVNQQAQITITDTGKGIKPEFLSHIFESFRQEDASTTRKYGGLGLGLAIVRHLVEAHGGTVWADSKGEGQGATFMVQFPLLDTKSGQSQIDTFQDPEPDLTGIRVLTVDDEPDARELLTAVLTQYGAEVLSVASAADVLANLASFQPDVLISDIGMPEVDGYTLIQQVRALPATQGGQIQAIALTAYAREEDHQRTTSSGYQKHITKPLEPMQLVQAVVELAQYQS